MPEQPLWTVSQLNQTTRLLLEHELGQIWIEGELSNLSRPHSGHLYFSLKDDQAQIRCALFRTHGTLLNFTPENGQHVHLRAKVSLYEVRGDYQLIVTDMSLAGDGLLQHAFEQLRQTLSAQGLFASEYKQPLPSLPRQIGVITSATGAAIQDILTTLQRRFPAIPVVVYPCEVQGKQAAPHIVRAIECANRHNQCDVLLLARGGGSLEDLWGFNQESVARAIFASHLPIVSGVGHEVDVTIADWVADLRAATPTAAAEAVVPDQQQWHDHFTGCLQQLHRAMTHWLNHHQHTLHQYRQRLRHPHDYLLRSNQQLDFIEQQLIAHWRTQRYHCTERLNQLHHQLQQQHPQQKLQRTRQQIDWLQQQLRQHIRQCLTTYQQRWQQASQQLHTLSPLATLARGYAIAFDRHQHPIKQASDVNLGDRINLRLSDAEIDATVEQVKQLD
ncbi:MAG: exodeoxyribonuclease VII large subunit [Legionellales bacterium]|nr:exodeoxyribonuclease VII large subunit [Legionellales bacterium]